MSTRINQSKRDFLITSSVSAAGLTVGFSLPAEAQTVTQNAANAWILVGTDNMVTVYVAASEMGQGTMSGLAQIAADELQVNWNNVKAQHAPVDAIHGGANAGPYGRFTAGSLGIRLFGPGMRQAAANARAILVKAAAQEWGVSEAGLTVNNGIVTDGSRTLTYGYLASKANTVTLSGNAPTGMRPKVNVGASVKRTDIPDKVTGAAKFGIDIWFPDMVFASVKHCPTITGTVSSFAKPSGALAAVAVGATGTKGNTGVAVVAATTWDAIRLARSASVNWTLPTDTNSLDSTAIAARAAQLMTSGTPIVAKDVNSSQIPTGLAAPNRAINASYTTPFIAHAALEPLSCTSKYNSTAKTLEVWAPTQAPDSVKATATALCPAGTTITVTNTLVGGAFGRKFEQDFIRESIQVALAYPNKPVKLTWSREEDFGNDMYRPYGLSRVIAAANPTTGKITAWNNRVVTTSISYQRNGNVGLDTGAMEGAYDLPYYMPQLVEYIRHDANIPLGYFRSVGHSSNCFPVESAMDELATAIGWDPIDFRLNNLNDSRMSAVLSAVKTFSGWTTPVASGHARGVAITKGFGSYIAMVVEVSATTTGVTVHKVDTVIDCGTAINPDSIKAQIEGAVSQAMGVTFWAQQTFVKGVPQAHNFSHYRVPLAGAMPVVNVQIIADGSFVGGVGETGVPCIAPAIANALAKLQGSAARRRTLPFFPGATMSD